MHYLKQLLLWVSILGFGSQIVAQDTLKLWDGTTPPFYLENDLVESEQDNSGALCAFDVTEPTLTIYPPVGEAQDQAVIVNPGGGYSVVAIHHEGHDVARALADSGITAAVLKYRIPNPVSSSRPQEVPLSDARRAIKLMRSLANEYGFEQRKVGVVGFSAGSHLSTLTCLWKSNNWQENPRFAGLIYGVTRLNEANQTWLEESLYFRKLTRIDQARNQLLNLVSAQTPPTFLVHAFDDTVCHVDESIEYAKALSASEVPAELHIFPTGGHGFGLGHESDGTDQWIDLFIRWVSLQ